ncbi:Predicted ATPase [Serratia fonticola]|uniref:AAA family ATPase n=1 Tax=Serratia fonticola TaxID=47917 RepID=UPI00217A7EEB|nr:ATP-binding protein [Serratia fonticola]CAI1876389.1 Predicted ATPase [Serratia fonticola]
MFISLKIENFLSIRDEVEFSLAASNDGKHLPNHAFFPEGHQQGILKSIGIYGANASGKSNVLKAFMALKYLVQRTGDLKNGEKIACYQPYKLSKLTKTAPTKFTVEFLLKSGTKYIYSISYNAFEILSEVLDYYPSRARANLFTRSDNDGWEDIKFGGHYKGGSRRIAFFKNNAYLSKAGNNASSPDVVKEIYEYFNTGLVNIGIHTGISMSSVEDLDARQGMTKNISTFLSLIDTGVKSIELKDRDTSEIKIPDDIPEEVRQAIIDENSVNVVFSHETDYGDDELFQEHEESDGTQRLLSVSPLLIIALKSKLTIVFDELDNKLHPHIADLIIRLFNDPRINVHGSQLIFSTHNMQLMTPDKMRRDQIWFSDKKNGVTSIYSLNDFDKNKVKTNTPYNKWYDDGRFGGVPRINYTKIVNFLLSDTKENEPDDDVFGSVDDILEHKD